MILSWELVFHVKFILGNIGVIAQKLSLFLTFQ